MNTRRQARQTWPLSHDSNQATEGKIAARGTWTGKASVLLLLALLLSSIEHQPATAHAQNFASDWSTIDGGGTSSGGIVIEHRLPEIP
jgi:hypothetical protein